MHKGNTNSHHNNNNRSTTITTTNTTTTTTTLYAGVRNTSGSYDAPALHSRTQPLPCGIGSRQNQRLREQTLTEKHATVDASKAVDEWNSQHLPAIHCTD